MAGRQANATGTSGRATRATTRGKSSSKSTGTHGDRTTAPADVGEPLAYNIRQAAAKLNLSHAYVERLVASGELFSVKAGAARLIPAWATVAYLRDLCRASDPGGRFAAEYEVVEALAG